MRFLAAVSLAGLMAGVGCGTESETRELVKTLEKELGARVTLNKQHQVVGLVVANAGCGFAIRPPEPPIDSKLEHLKGLRDLQTLTIYKRITGTGLAHLKDLAKLRELRLSFTKVADAGLVHLKRLKKLKSLWLWNTNVTDAGLEHLEGLTNLQILNLVRTKVTDAGLVHLKGLTNLQNLNLEETKVTGTGVKQLQQALPNCKIQH